MIRCFCSEIEYDSVAVFQLIGESEWLVFIGGAQQVPHPSRTPFLQHQPAGVLSNRLLLCSFFCLFSLQPPEDEKRMEMLYYINVIS